jgi:hypothetical protein
VNPKLLPIIHTRIDSRLETTENTDKYMAPLQAIAMIFAYGIPALLIIFGFISYVNALSNETHDLGLALLIIGIILYVIELIARLAMLIEEHSEP